ncbi:MAG: hypothetical protein KAX20_02160 [Candidatus Omnitrophica bacterium]|nr:hypothetical protein [Candidatus Omnitrophota bacterium]
MSKWIICLVFGLSFFIHIHLVQAIEVNLSKSEAEQAISWGEREEKEHILRKCKFRCSTSIHEYGYLITKYADLALAASKAKEKGNKLSEEEQKEVLSRKDFIVEIHTVGDRIDFAREYSLVIITSRSIKGRRELEVVAPTKTESDTLGKPRETWPMSPGYEAVVKGFFPYEKIRPKEKIIVILIRSKWEEEKELRFDVNLSQYK